MEVITKNAEETKELGRKIGSELKVSIYALTGELGSGKTTFVQGFAQGLGVSARILSPTFILMRCYEAKDKTFCHVDLYRLEKNLQSEVENFGLTDIWGKPESVVIIEWAEKIREMIPKEAEWIEFENMGENERKITIHEAIH